MTSGEVIAALRKEYETTHVFLEQVAEGVGMSPRRVDAVAIGAWRSRGHALHAFEVKVSRRDWLRELKTPSKSDAVARYCHHFWVVTPPDILKESEVPEAWGIILVSPGGHLTYVRTVRPRAPEPLDAPFVVGILRRAEAAQQSIRQQAVATMSRDHHETCYHARDAETARAKYEALKAQLSALNSGSLPAAEQLALCKELLRADRGRDLVCRYLDLLRQHAAELAQEVTLLTDKMRPLRELPALTELKGDDDDGAR